MANRVDQMHVGALTATTFTIPDGTVGNAGVAAAAGIAASKLEHPVHITVAQESATTATDQSFVVHSVYGATGDIIAFQAGCVVVPIGAATVTVDLKKNGTSVLSAPITLDIANSVRVVEAGTLSVTTLVAGDVLEVVINETTGGGTQGKGVFATVVLHEDAAP